MTTIRRANPVGVYSILLGLLATGDALPAQEPASAPTGVVLMAPSLPDEVTGTLRTLNATLSKDLDPKDNLVVDLVALFGVEVFERPLRRASLAMLGIDRLPATGVNFLYLQPYVIAQGATAPEEQARALDTLALQLQAAQQQLWRQADFPELFEYLAANDKALDAVVAASRKPRYFAPLLSLEEPPRLLGASLVIERRLRYLADCLSARALRRLAEGNGIAAQDDLLACHRLAVKLAEGSPFDVSVAKADVVDAIACRADGVALQSGKVSAADARRWLAEWEKIPRIPSPDRAADRGERAIIHQEIEFLKSDEDSVEGFLEFPDAAVQEAVKDLTLAKLPWDAALKRADEVQDQIVQALATRDRAEQMRLFEQLDRDYAKWQEAEPEKFRQLGTLVETDPVAASRLVGEAMAHSLRTNYWQRRHSEDRSRLRRDMLTIGLALLIYRGEHGEYPQTLAELAPTILKSVPLEAHSDEPFVYDRSAPDHCRLMSRGANRQDDANQEYNDDQALELH